MASDRIAELMHGTRIFDNRPASWSENFIRQFSPESFEQESSAWKYLTERDENLSRFGDDGIFNSQLIPDGSDWTLGHMKASVATSRMMAQDYWRGITARNAAADQIKADRMMRGRDNLKPGIGGALTEEHRDFLTPFQSTWSNWTKGATLGLGSYVDPLAGTRFGWGSAPEDLWDIKMPGFTTNKMLEELNEADPTYHAFLIQRYGSPEQIEEAIGEANNPDHFFYLLNTDIEQAGIHASIQHADQHMDGMEEWWNLTAWPFLRDGLLNDPDMPASVAISVATMGLGTLATGVALGARAGFGSARIAKLTSIINKPAIRPLAWGGNKLFKVTDFLPENIATTLVKKHLWKNVPTKGLMGMAANAPFNATEGFIEGGLAEFFNQSMKIDRDVLDEYSIGAMWDEALVEAGFSIVANPLLGGLMKYTAGGAMGLTMRAAIGKGGERLWKNQKFSERTRLAFKQMFEGMGKEGESPIMKALDVYDMSEEIAGTLNTILGTKDRGLTGKNVDLELATILEPLTGILERGQAFEGLVSIKSALDSIAAEERNSASPLSGEQLIDRLIEHVQTEEMIEGGDSEGMFEALKGRAVGAKFKLAAYKHFRSQGMTPDQVAEAWDNQDFTDDEMMNIVLEGDGVRDSMVKGMLEDGTIKSGEDFDNLSAGEKFEWLQKLETKSEEALNKLEALFKGKGFKVINRTRALSKKAEDAGIEIEPEVVEDNKEIEELTNKFKAGYGKKEATQFAETFKGWSELETTTKESYETLITDLYDVFKGKLTTESFVETYGETIDITEETQVVISDIATLVVNGVEFENPFTVELGKIKALEYAVTSSNDEVVEFVAEVLKEGDDTPPGVTDPEVDQPVLTEKAAWEADLKRRNQEVKNIQEKTRKARDASKEAEEIEKFDAILKEAAEILEELETLFSDLDAKAERNEVTKDLDEQIKLKDEELKEAYGPVVEAGNEHNRTERGQRRGIFSRLFAGWSSKSLSQYAKTGDKGLSSDQKVLSESSNPDLWKVTGEMLNSLDGKVLKKEGHIQDREGSKGKRVLAEINKLKENFKQGNPLTISDINFIHNEYLFRETEIDNYARHTIKGTRIDAIIKERQSLIRQLRRERFKLVREKAGALGLASLQISSVTEAIKYRKRLNESLDKKVTGFKAVAERKSRGGMTFAASEFAQYLPEGGKARLEVLRRGEEEISVDEAHKIFDKAEKAERKAIKIKAQPGRFRGISNRTMQNNPGAVSRWSVHSLGEVPASQRSNAQAIEATGKARDAAGPRAEGTKPQATRFDYPNVTTETRDSSGRLTEMTRGDKMLAPADREAMDPDVRSEYNRTMVEAGKTDLENRQSLKDAPVGTEVTVTEVGRGYKNKGKFVVSYEATFVKTEDGWKLKSSPKGDVRTLDKWGVSNPQYHHDTLIKQFNGEQTSTSPGSHISIVYPDSTTPTEATSTEVDRDYNKLTKAKLIDLIIERNIDKEENRKALSRRTKNRTKEDQPESLIELLQSADLIADIEAKAEGKHKQVESLLIFHASLVGIKDSHWYTTSDGLVPIAIIDSALPSDIFDTQLVTWFREAMRDINGVEIDENITGEELLELYDTLLVDLDQVLKLVSVALAKANTDIKNISEMGIEQLSKKMTEQGGSRFGLITSINLVRRLQAASVAVNRKLFKPHEGEAGNFVLSSDSEVGYDYNWDHVTTDESEFVDGVESGFRRRLTNRILNIEDGWKRSKAFKHLVERYDIDPDIENPEVVAEAVFRALQKEAGGVSREEIIKMGNGELSFMPADMLGGQLFEFILSRDGIQPLRSPRNRDFAETTLGKLDKMIVPDKYTKLPQGEAEQVLPYMYGELNIIAPEPLEKIALALEDQYLRERIKHITQGLKRDPDNPDYLDASVHEEFDKLIAEVSDLSDDPRAISPQLKPGVRVRSYLQNAVLHGEMLSREETEDALVELLLGHAHTGYYFIHDNKFTNYRTMYNEDTGDTHEVLTLGDPTIMPMSGIGANLALEQMMPFHAPLTDATIEEQIRIEREYAEELGMGEDYYTNPEYWNTVLSPALQKDRKFNGYYVSKILGITDPEVRKAIRELVDGALEISVPDMYINKGILMFNLIKGEGKAELFGPLESVFQFMEDAQITDHATWEAAVEDGLLPDGSPVDPAMKKKLKVLRDFLKNPMMTRLYEAGRPAFDKYWKTGEGRTEIWPKLVEAGLVKAEDLDPGRIPKVIDNIGTAMYNTEIGEIAGGLSAALNLKDYKDRAKERLKLDERFTKGSDEKPGLFEHWQSVVKTVTGRDLPEGHLLRKLDYYARQLNYNISRMAERRGYELGSKERAKFEADERNKIVAAQKRLDEMKDSLDPGEDLTPEMEAELMAMLQPKNAWKENLYFLTLNTMNASGYKMFTKAMEAQALAFGIPFDTDWLMGLEDFTLYHTFMPGEESHRTYPTEASLNRHHHTVAWGKINDNPEALEAWMSENITAEDLAEVAKGNPNHVMQKLWDWLGEQESESPAGVWRMEDNPHYVGSKENTSEAEWNEAENKLRRKVKDLMLIDDLIGLAQFDRVPLESYTRENNMEALDQDILTDWSDPKKNSNRTAAMKQRLAFQRDASPDSRRSMAKAGQLGHIHPDDTSPINTRGTHEWKMDALSRRRGGVIEATDNPRGVFAWQPRIETTPYLGLGNLELQRRLYEQEVEEAFGPLKEIQAELDAETDPLADVIPSEHRGHVKPWDREHLPPALPLSDIDLLDSMLGMHFDPASREAAKMEKDLRVWARENGMSQFLDPTSPDYDIELVPYLYLVQQTDQIIEDTLTRSISAIRYKSDDKGRLEHTQKENIIHAANRFKGELMKMFFLPRNIRRKTLDGLSLETPGHEIGITDPKLKNMKLGEILTSIYDPHNNVDGVLHTPTLLHKALGYGLVPKEHFVISAGVNPGEGIDIKEGDPGSTTDIWPLIVQSHDFQSYLVEMLWDSHVWSALTEFSNENDGVYNHLMKKAQEKDEQGKYRRKEVWNEIDPDDRKAIINKARNIRLDKEANGVLFEMNFIVEEVDGDFSRAILDSKNLENDNGMVPAFRNAFGGPFSFLIRTRRVVKGATIKFGLTPEGAMLMLASNTNQSLKERVELAYHTKKRLGVKKDSNGKYVSVESESQTIKQEHALDMRAAYDNAILESDAMKIMVNRIDQDLREDRRTEKQDDKIRTLVDDTRKNQNIAPTVVDWTHYAAQRVNGKSFLVEALVSPLRRHLHHLRASGLDGLKSRFDEKTPAQMIEGLLSDMTGNMADPKTMVAIQTALLMRDPKITAEESLAVMDQVTSEDTTDPVHGDMQEKIKAARLTMSKAEAIVTKIKRVMDAPNSEVFGKYYRDARVYLEKVFTGEEKLQEGKDFEKAFLEWVVVRRDIDTDPLFRDPNFESDVAFALAAATQDHENFERPLVGLNPEGKPVIPRRNTDYRNHRSFIAAYDNHPKIVEISKTIKDLWGDGSLEARMLRAVVGRVWEYNPSTILHTEFTFDGMISFMEKVKDNDYKLGVRRRGTDPWAPESEADGLERPVAELAYSLAHEFSHVGYIKFIKENTADHRQWRQLFVKERQNPTLIKQIVLAAHGGVDSPAVQKEINYYLNYVDPKTGRPSEAEFVAALTGYYMLNDTLPVALDPKVKGMLGRIMAYIHNMLSKVSGVFHNFKTEKPDEWQAIEMLIERTMGYERTTNTFRFEQGNTLEGRLYLADGDSDTSTSEDTARDGSLAALAGEAKNLAERIDSIETELTLPDVADSRRDDLAKELEEITKRSAEVDQEIVAQGGDEKDPFGLTQVDYAFLMNDIKRKYTNETTNGIDLDKLRAVGSRSEHRAIASYITRLLSTMYEGEDGNFMMEADQALGQMPWFSDQKGMLNKFFTGGVIGSTGANYTWNSPFQLIVFLSTLVDNSLSTLPGHWGNWQGLPSIMATLETQQQNVETMRTRFDSLMTKLVGSPIESIVRMNKLAPDSQRAKEAERVRDEVGRDILRKIERPEVEFESQALKADPEAAKIAMEVVGIYTSMMQNMLALAKEYDFRGNEFTELVPIRLATGKLSSPDHRGLKAFTKSITNAITNQFLHGTNGKIDPWVAYEAGILPSIADASKGLSMMEELRKPDSGGEGVWKQIIIHARAVELVESSTNMDRKTAIKKAREEFDKGNLADDYGSKLAKHSDEPEYREESEDFYNNIIIPGVVSVMKRMRSIQPDQGTMAEFEITGNRMRTAYEKAYTKEGKGLRIGELDTAIMYESGLIKDRSSVASTPPMNTPMDVHIRNIVAGAGNNVFFRNAWAIPTVSTMMDMDGVSDLMLYDPASIADGAMRSLGQNASMKGFFKEHFNLHVSGTGEAAIGDKTPVHSILNIFRDVFADGNLLNDDQTTIANQDIDKLQTSIRTLKEKIDVSLGRGSSMGPDSDGTLSWAVKYAPDMVRTIYGTNLTMATLVVENSMNLMDNLFGRGSIADFVTGATAPFTRMFGKKDSDMKVVAGDMAEVLRVFSQAFIPDYLRPDSQARKKFISILPQWLGERNMHMAGQIHEMIASSRAVIFRRWLQRHLADESLQKLPQYLKGVKPTDWKGLKNAMRLAGVRSGDYNIVAYLMNEGFFNEGAMKIEDIQKLASTRGEGVYSHGDMLLEASQVDMTSDTGTKEYRKRQKMISALKRAEKRFIEDVLIAPNPFDVNTKNESWNKLIEIFRRYPVLFAAQQMIRRKGRFSPTRTVFHLTSYALFDMLYMQLLLLAAGYSPEELKDKWRDDPAETMITSLVRLPHLGRYFGVLAEFAMIVGGVGYGRSPMGLIPMTALQSYFGQARQVAQGALSKDKDIDPHLPVMLMRILPFMGAFTRMTWFNVMGADYQRPASGKSSGGPRNHKGTFADTTNMADYHYQLREILTSTGMYDPDDKGLFHRLPQEVQQSMRDYANAEAQNVLTGPESSPEPSGGQGVPQTAPETQSSVQGSQGAIEQIKGMRPEEAPIELM